MKHNKAMKDNLRTPNNKPMVGSIGSGLSFGAFTVPSPKIRRSRPILPKMKKQNSRHSLSGVDNNFKDETSKQIKKNVSCLSKHINDQKHDSHTL